MTLVYGGCNALLAALTMDGSKAWLHPRKIETLNGAFSYSLLEGAHIHPIPSGHGPWSSKIKGILRESDVRCLSRESGKSMQMVVLSVETDSGSVISDVKP